MHLPRPRDSFGWAIPRPDTMSYHIYLAMRRGYSVKEISITLNMNRHTVGVLAWGIRHPDTKAAKAKEHYLRKKLREAQTTP